MYLHLLWLIFEHGHITYLFIGCLLYLDTVETCKSKIKIADIGNDMTYSMANRPVPSDYTVHVSGVGP